MTAPEPHSHRLDGCSPTPLASYLKALGILRLLSSPANSATCKAADPCVRGWWEKERFHLRTTLSKDALLRFFLEEYAPSPIIAPWNGRAGFLEGDDQEESNRTGSELMRQLEESGAARFGNMRLTIRRLRGNRELARLNQLRARTKALKEESKALQGEARRSKDKEGKDAERKEKESKSMLLPALRSKTDSEHLSYVDACYVLATDETPMPLLGSGGNDGSRDFGVNFAEELTRLFECNDGSATHLAESTLEGALLGGGRLHSTGTMGLFSPGQGGSNATTGYKGSNPLNPWDIVLAMEGTIVFAGALTRSWGSVGDSRAAFPFTFEPIGAGAGIFSPEDPNRPRGEVWTPLWKKPAVYPEIAAIFSEGRLTLGYRTARTGLEAARAVGQIGLSRGINGFERYSIIQSDRKMPLQATPLGRIATPDSPQRRDLIVDLEAGDWLARARKLAGDRKKAPSRARQALRRLEDSLFQMTMTDSGMAAQGTRNALMAMGAFVEWLAMNREARGKLEPPPELSQDWARQADDGSPEFRVALALAGLGLPTSPPVSRSGLSSPEVTAMTNPADMDRDESPASDPQAPALPALPMAAHFAPIDENGFYSGTNLRRRRAWTKDNDTKPTVVWGSGGLVSNMIRVLERRTVEAAMRGLQDKLLASTAYAPADSVSAFLRGNFDDTRCATLLRGLVWASVIQTYRTGSSCRLPFAYAVLKPIFSTDAVLRRVRALDDTTRMPLPPGLLARLRTAGGSMKGHATDYAVRAALMRARGSGLGSPFDRVVSRRSASDRIGAGIRADRLAASLLIPIGEQDLKALLARSWSLDTPDNDRHMEEENHAN